MFERIFSDFLFAVFRFLAWRRPFGTDREEFEDSEISERNPDLIHRIEERLHTHGRGSVE